MCETRDLGIEWPYWHTFTFEGHGNCFREESATTKKKEGLGSTTIPKDGGRGRQHNYPHRFCGFPLDFFIVLSCFLNLTFFFSFFFSFFVDFLFRLYLPLLFFFLVCCQGVKKKKLREHAQRIYSPKSRLRSEWSRNAAKLGRER